MKEFILARSRRQIVGFFLAIYAVTLLCALFPPLYLAASGIRASVLGIPFSIMYWVADWVVLGLGLWGFYAVENLRGELDESHTTQTLTGE